MSEGSRLITGILALAQIFLSCLWFSVGYATLGYAWLGVGVMGLIFAAVYDTDTFKQLNDGVKKKLFLMITFAFCVGGVIGYLVYGVVGAVYGICVGSISAELIGAFYILFFTGET
jgi:hypothetical protein